jgi:hypothetical protein
MYCSNTTFKIIVINYKVNKLIILKNFIIYKLLLFFNFQVQFFEFFE